MAKITYEQIDQDGIAEGLHEGLEWSQKHRNLLIGLFVALLVIVVVGMAVVNHNMKQMRAANELMGTALSASGRIEAAADADVRKEGLKSLEEAVKTLNEKYAGQPLALEGLFLLGNAYYRTDDFAQAQDYYSQYIAKARSNEQKARGEIAMGYAAENESFLKTEQGSTQQTEKLNQALAHYENALQLTPQADYVHYYALLSKARMLELTSKNDEAIAIYQEILKERPEETPGADAKDEDLGGMLGLFRDQIQERESLLSFASTAKLRLDRLTATDNVASTQLAGPELAAPAPAATATPTAN